jgi:hypothetical protein
VRVQPPREDPRRAASQEGEGDAGPQTTRQWQRVGAAGSDSVFPCAPLRSQVSESAGKQSSQPSEGLGRAWVWGGGDVWSSSPLSWLCSWVMHLLNLFFEMLCFKVSS